MSKQLKLCRDVSLDCRLRTTDLVSVTIVAVESHTLTVRLSIIGVEHNTLARLESAKSEAKTTLICACFAGILFRRAALALCSSTTHWSTMGGVVSSIESCYGSDDGAMPPPPEEQDRTCARRANSNRRLLLNAPTAAQMRFSRFLQSRRQPIQPKNPHRLA